MWSYVREALALGIPCGLQILVGVPAFEIARYARTHDAALVILSVSGDLRGRLTHSWSRGALEQILSCSLWQLVVVRACRRDEPEQYN
jgi:nucleotide-binding universal stress UspA family protein